MKRIVFILLSISIVTFTKAQTSGEYDLSEYALPDLELQTLDFNFGLSGDGSGLQYNPDFETENSDLSGQSHSLSLQSDYSLYRNTRKQQLNLEAGFSLGGGFNERSENDKLVYKKRFFGPSLSLRLNSRFYLNDKFFYGAEPELRTSFGLQKEKSRNYDGDLQEDKSNRTSADILLPLKIGVGRIESVTDARQAIFILEALKDNGHLNRTASKEEITAFAELISKTRNRRFFDSRIQKIKELEALDGFLKNEDFVENNDISYFTTLMDYWNYGRPVFMGAGNRFSLVLAPGYRIYNSVSDEPGTLVDDKSRSTYKSLQAGVKYFHTKPHGLHWHHSLSFRAFAGWLKYESGHPDDPVSTTREESHPNLQFRHGNNLNYYMNTRTTVKVGYDISYTHFIDDSQPENEVLSTSGDVVSGSINLNAYYYISPKLRLSFDSRLNYFWQDFQDFPLEGMDMWDWTDSGDVYTFYPVTDLETAFKGHQKKFNFNYSLSLSYSLF
ncbi:MAG: hypothetical protein ACQER7_15240 [Bacteroidota bacterium]